MFTIFSCSINVTVTSQNWVPSFHLHQRAYTCIKELICDWVIYTPKIFLFFYVCCIEMVENVYGNTKMKI